MDCIIGLWNWNYLESSRMFATASKSTFTNLYGNCLLFILTSGLKPFLLRGSWRRPWPAGSCECTRARGWSGTSPSSGGRSRGRGCPWADSKQLQYTGVLSWSAGRWGTRWPRLGARAWRGWGSSRRCWTRWWQPAGGQSYFPAKKRMRKTISLIENNSYPCIIYCTNHSGVKSNRCSRRG